MQHAVLRCGLRDGRLVWLVCLQRFLWPRHADAESGRVGCCVLRRRVLWRVVSGSAVQCAAVPRELHVECMVWLVCMQRRLWWRHANTDSVHGFELSLWWHALRRAVSSAALQHSPLPQLVDWFVEQLLCSMWQWHPDSFRDLL